MIAPDYRSAGKLLSWYLHNYSHMTKDIENGWEIYKDDFGVPLFAGFYLKVTLKDDADYIAELADHKQIRVANRPS